MSPKPIALLCATLFLVVGCSAAPPPHEAAAPPQVAAQPQPELVPGGLRASVVTAERLAGYAASTVAPEAAAPPAPPSEPPAPPPEATPWPGPGDQPQRYEVAISLGSLQQALARGTAGATTLGGVNRFFGVLLTDNDVVLVGAIDPSIPPVHVDDLAVALRVADPAGDWAGQCPGCTIDPDPAASDPWAVQTVKILGMPPSSRMAAHCVGTDLITKQHGAGMGPGLAGIPSVVDRLQADRCDSSSAASAGAESHRYEFLADTPRGYRFRRDGDLIHIAQPMQVRLSAHRQLQLAVGAEGLEGAPSPEAAAYAEDVTRMLQCTPSGDFASLVSDFRLHELAALLAVVGAPAPEYFLHAHVLGSVAVPTEVPGVARTVTLDCEPEVTEWPTATGMLRQTRQRRWTLQHRGGVDERVHVRPSDVHPTPGLAGDWPEIILRSRPRGAWKWLVRREA